MSQDHEFRNGLIVPDTVPSLEQLAISDPGLAQQLGATLLQYHAYPKNTDPEQRLKFIREAIDSTFGFVARQDYALRSALADGELRETSDYFGIDTHVTGFIYHYNMAYSYVAMWPSIENGGELVNLIHNGGLYNVDKDGRWLSQLAAAPYSPAFNAKTHQLAIRKLGCGLALFQQALHESAFLGAAIPTTYKPIGDRWEESWRDEYNEPIPTLTTLADPNDNLLRHLIAHA